MSRFSAFSRCLPLVTPTPEEPEPPVGGKKFNTGYYWAPLTGGSGPLGVHDYTGLLNDLRDIPNINGCLIRANWHELETSQGVYDWSAFNQIYTAVSTLPTPKRLCVLLEFRSTADDPASPGPIVPAYVDNNPALYGGATGNGGTWIATGGASENLKNIRYMCMWNVNLLNRLKALSDAFAAQFDTRPYFEMVQFSEPIVGDPKGGAAAQEIPGTFATTYPDGIKNWVLYTNTKFTNTIVSQLCNYPQSLNTTYIPSLRDAGIGVSCPNSLKDEPGLWVNGTNKGIWQWYSRTDAAKLQGVTVIAPHIQKPECYYSNLSTIRGPEGVDGLGRFPGQGYTPQYGANGAEEICDLLKSVGANYAFVTRAPQETPSQQFGDDNQNAIDIPAWQAYFQRPLAQIALNSTRPSNLP